MIFVSSETGSAHLVAPLRRLGLSVEDPVKLDYADVEFSGRGVRGVATSIGIEVKRLSELTTDWDRLCGAQIPKMQGAYEHRWLLVIGEWLPDRQGRLQKRGSGGRLRPHHGQNNAASLQKKLLTLELCAGMHVQRVKDDAAAVRFLADLFRWWNDEDLDKHKSHLVIYHPQSLVRDSDFVLAVGSWPGVGRQRAKAAEQVFRSVRRAALASLHEWAAVETHDDDGKPRKIGLKTAARIVDFLEGV